MNNLCNVAAGSKEDALRIEALSPMRVRMAETIHVLSVGPVNCGSMVHDALLDGVSFRLSIATDYRELWKMPVHESIHVAVLHDTLSSFELEAACRLIRRRWPRARILLISKQESSLDDALYDDRASTAAGEVLLAAIERLTRWRHGWPQVNF